MNSTQPVTKRSAKRLALGVIAAASLAACSKSPSPSTAFGVNVTVDAKASSLTTLLPKIHSARLNVTGAEMVTRAVADAVAPLQKDHEARFRFIPADTVKASDKLVLSFDVLDVDGIVLATGAAPEVTLAATAVNVTITLGGGSSGDGGPDDATPTGDGSGSKLGVTCAGGAECASGVCADGVCCNVACDGVCESCKLATSLGTCTAIPADTDPDLECAEKTPVAAPEPDGGTAGATGTDGGDAAAAPASDASSDAGAGAGDGSDETGSDSDAAVINTPVGGFMTIKGACGGKCNGARACKYPTTSCGTPFCNTHKEVGSFVCDGAGSCGTALSGCTDYACDDTKGACHTNCSGPDDCQLGDYCSTGGTCLPRKVISVACATDGECKTDHCSSGVCCNTGCTGTGLSCNDPGMAGQCKCTGVTCAAGVACQIFYRDFDLDGFGDRNGTIAAATAKAGCMGAAPPAGFVVDNTDCDDSDANAHPGQTAFFGVQRKSGGFDYDCDDKIVKFTPEYPGGSCKYCGAIGSCDATTNTCSTAGQTGSFQCPQEGSVIRALSEPTTFTTPENVSVTRASLATAAVPTATVSPAPTIGIPCKACFLQCCGCQTNDKRGFLAAVACGATASVYSCGGCAAVGGGSPLSATPLQQTCR